MWRSAALRNSYFEIVSVYRWFLSVSVPMTINIEGLYICE